MTNRHTSISLNAVGAQGETVTVTFDLYLQADPVCTAGAAMSMSPVAVTQGQQVTTNVAAEITDADTAGYDTLTWTTSSLPSWIAFNSATKVFTVNATAGATSQTVTVTATDTTGGSDSCTITFNPTANVAPVITVTTYLQTFVSPATEGVIRSGSATDADGGPNANIAFTATGVPSFLTFTDTGATTFQLTGNGGNIVGGSYNITVKADDGASSSTQVWLVQYNQIPVIVTPITSITTVTQDHSYLYTIPNTLFNDLDGDSLTITFDDSAISPAYTTGTSGVPDSIVENTVANVKNLTIYAS